MMKGQPMSVESVLHEILSVNRLMIPKPGKMDVLRLPSGFPQPLDVDPATVHRVFGNLVEDRGEKWYVKCIHRCQPAAGETAICDTVQRLGVPLPEELDCFLRVANGAELFVAARAGLEDFPGTFHVRYKLFGTDELVRKNRELLQFFRAALGKDPAFQHVKRLNYLAFCDVTEGNYLAILLEGDGAGKVFHLDRELCARPYRERDADIYYTLADSLEGWLILLRDTGGWAGRGTMIGGF
jgi:hypothetical protein